MRFILIFLLISTTAFSQDKIYTCKPIAAAAVMETGQMYSETLADMDEEARAIAGVGDNLLRFSVGIESTEDLVSDLTAALNRAERA